MHALINSFGRQCARASGTEYKTKSKVYFVLRAYSDSGFYTYVKRKLFEPQGPLGSAVDLLFLSLQGDASLHSETTDTGLLHRAVCLFTSQLSLILIAPTHGWMARLC